MKEKLAKIDIITDNNLIIQEYIINISNSKENLCIQKYPPDSTESLPNPYIIEYDIIENIFLQLLLLPSEFFVFRLILRTSAFSIKILTTLT